MKTIWLVATAGAALSLAACGPNATPPIPFGARAPMKPLARLDCPEKQGALTRVSAASDGSTCEYTDEDGALISLRRVALNGTPEATLAVVEQGLRAYVPGLTTATGARPAAKAGVVVPAEAASPQSKAAADAAARTAALDADMASKIANKAAGAEDKADDASDRGSDGGDHVSIDLPGFHINTEGENARLNIAGIKINADDENNTVRVVRKPKSGVGRSFSVDASDNGAVIRTESGNRVNVKSMLILASDTAGPQGDQVVGYVAHGPRTGPLVVATIRSKDKDKDHGVEGRDLFNDVNKLVKKNAGG